MKSCPFCKRKIKKLDITKHRDIYSMLPIYFVECPKCACRGPRTLSSETDAIRLWNNRRQHTPAKRGPKGKKLYNIGQEDSKDEPQE